MVQTYTAQLFDFSTFTFDLLDCMRRPRLQRYILADLTSHAAAAQTFSMQKDFVALDGHERDEHLGVRRRW